MDVKSPLITLLDNHERSRQLYSVALEAYVGATVVEFSDIEEAADFISSNTVSIIITRGLFDQRDMGVKFSQMIEKNSLETKLVVIGTTRANIYQAALFPNDVEVKEVIKKCASLLGITAKAMAEKDVGEYYPIRLSLICPNLSLVCPIYRKSPDGEFIKFLDIDSQLYPEILSILQGSGDKEIYVQAAQRLKFVNSLSIFLSELMADDRLTIQDTVLLANSSYNIVRDSARRMMISPVTIQATEVNINTMISITNRIPKLKELLDISENNVGLIFRHSLLTCFVSSHIISKMEWGTKGQKVKMAFVCFFCNLLIEQDDHIFIHEKEDMELLNIPESQWDKIMLHPINSAKLMSKYYRSLPFGVDTIVKQHHGNRYGNDFTLNPASVSPLALVYVISDELSSLIMKAESRNLPLTRAEMLTIIKNKYKGVMFQEIIEALKELTI